MRLRGHEGKLTEIFFAGPRPRRENFKIDTPKKFQQKVPISNFFFLGNLVRVNVTDHSGYFLTEEQVPAHPLSGRRSPATYCIYGFWIAYVRNKR